MKHLTKIPLIAATLILSSCNDSMYVDTRANLAALADPETHISCEQIESLQACKDAPACQPLFESPDELVLDELEENLIFSSCIDIPLQDPIDIPTTDPVEEPIQQDPVQDPVMDPIDDPVADPIEGPIKDPVIEPIPEPELPKEKPIDEDKILEACEGRPQGKKVTICHYPPGNHEAAHSITIGCPALQAHLGHHDGDHIGVCSQEELLSEDEKLSAEDLEF